MVLYRFKLSRKNGLTKIKMGNLHLITNKINKAQYKQLCKMDYMNLSKLINYLNDEKRKHNKKRSAK